MSPHWRLALVYAASLIVLSALLGLFVFLVYGGAYSVALLYGAFVGMLSFVSTAFTVSLLTGRSTSAGMMVGGASFAARLAFAAVALGVPAYLEPWPTVVMLAGFVSVYLAENLLLVPVLLGKRQAGIGGAPPMGERIKRRAKV